MFIAFMRPLIFQVTLLAGLVLSGSFALAGNSTLPDTVYGIPRDRFMEFRKTYMVGVVQFGEQFVPRRLVGYFGKVGATGTPANAVMGFLETNRDIFKLEDVQTELALDTIETDDAGGQTVVLQQMFHGLEVAGCHLRFKFTPEASLEEITARYFPDIAPSLKPEIDSVAAIETVRDSLVSAGNAPTGLGCRLCILPFSRSFRLAWQVEYRAAANRPQRIQPMFVDAQSGAIIPEGSY